MPRQFRTVDYEATLDSTVRLRDMLPDDHLARFVADMVAQLDVSTFYARYGSRGGLPYAPEVLLALLFYGYATGVFSSRRIEQATYDQAPFRFLAGNTHPDHDTLAHFRTEFLDLLPDLFTQLLMLAQATGVLRLGSISLDGTKIHADASKSKAVSYKRLLELETALRREVDELLARGAATDVAPLPDGLVVSDEIADRQARLAKLAEAKAVLEARASERQAAEQAAYEAKVREREVKARRRGGKPRGRAPKPKPPTGGVRDSDQYNFTDPDSRIMKNSTNKGMEQAYNAQAAVDQGSRLIVGHALSNHANDVGEVAPTLDSIPSELGKPDAVAMDAGYFSEENVAECARREIDAHIATGRSGHRRSWQDYFAAEPEPPGGEATVRERMAYKLRTAAGRAIYRLRKSTVGPVIGIIKEVLGFRQFSLRGELKAAGEWCLVCLAYNVKRYHSLDLG